MCVRREVCRCLEEGEGECVSVCTLEGVRESVYY